GHAVRQESLALGAGELLVIGADFAGFHLFLRRQRRRRRGEIDQDDGASGADDSWQHEWLPPHAYRKYVYHAMGPGAQRRRAPLRRVVNDVENAHPTGMRVGELLRNHWPAITIAVTAAAIAGLALVMLSNMPPHTIVMATGPEGDAYFEIGKRYRDVLAKANVEVQLVPTAGHGGRLPPRHARRSRLAAPPRPRPPPRR